FPAMMSIRLTDGIDDPEMKQRLNEVYQLIWNQATENETLSGVEKISDGAVQKVYVNALVNARTFNAACDKTTTQIEGRTRLADRQHKFAGALIAACDNVLSAYPDAEKLPSDDARQARSALAGVEDSLNEAMLRLYGDMNAASDEYTARRYDAEAKNNRVT